MELQEGVAIGRVRDPFAADGVKQSRERVQNEVEVALRILLAEAAEGLAVNFEFGGAAIRELDPVVAALAQAFGKLEKRGVDVDWSLPKAQLPQVVNDDARHDPVFVMRGHLH